MLVMIVLTISTTNYTVRLCSSIIGKEERANEYSRIIPRVHVLLLLLPWGILPSRTSISKKCNDDF